MRYIVDMFVLLIWSSVAENGLSLLRFVPFQIRVFNTELRLNFSNTLDAFVRFRGLVIEVFKLAYDIPVVAVWRFVTFVWRVVTDDFVA